MAALSVAEFQYLAGGNSEEATQAAKAPGTANQSVAIGAGSVQSNAFNADTGIIRICPDIDCWILIGSNPTAAAGATSIYQPAKVPEYYGVNRGDKIAVITA